MADQEEKRPLEELLHLGKIGLEAGYWQEAEAYFDQVLARVPDHPEALLGKAQACRNPRQALELIRRVLAENPFHPEALQLQKFYLVELGTPPTEGEAAPKVKPRKAFNRLASWGYLLAALAFVLALGGGLWVWQSQREQRSTYQASPELEAKLPQASPTGASASWLALQAKITPTPDVLAQATRATALILVPSFGESTEVSRGSGSVIDPQGLILTNYHVLRGEDGQLLNEEGLAFVGFTQDVRQMPTEWYIAALIAKDATRDLAILRILYTVDGKPVENPRFPTIPIGDPSSLNLGQPIMGLGYPALGGNTLTLTKGSMAGFRVGRGSVQLGKTDSELLPGSSGGAVLDEAGRLVGVISAAYTDPRTQGRLSYFVLYSEAQAIIAEASTAPIPKVQVDWMLQRFSQVWP